MVWIQTNNIFRTTFNQMKMLYRQEELAEERSIILNAMGFASDPNILSQVLDFAVSFEVPAQVWHSNPIEVKSHWVLVFCRYNICLLF